MAFYTIDGKTLTAIANAIRKKTGRTDLMLPTDFPAAIQSITGGVSKKLKFERYRTLYPSGGQTSFDVTSSSMSNDGRFFYNKGYVYDLLTTVGNEFSWQVKDEDGNPITTYKASFGVGGNAIYTAKAQPKVDGAQKGYDIVKVTKDSCTTLGSYTANVLAASPYCVNAAPDVEDDLYVSYFFADKEQEYRTKTWFLINGQVIEGAARTVDNSYNGFLFTRDGVKVIGYGREVRQFSRSTGEPDAEFFDPLGTISTFSLTSGNNYVVNTTGGTDIVEGKPVEVPILSVWAIEDYRKMYDFQKFFTEQGNAICIPDSTTILYCYRDGHALRAFDIGAGYPVEMTGLPAIEETLGYDASIVASYSGNRVAIVAKNFAEIWNVVEQ